MLFAKKQKFLITDAQIKEELKSEDGVVLVKLNLRYPEITCHKNDALAKNAQNLYPRIAQKLADFGKNELYKKALNSYKNSKTDILPFALVMRWENTYMDKKYLSILLDISITDGETDATVQRKTQIWDRTNGQLCDFSHFFPRSDLRTIFHDMPKGFRKELFVLRENQFEFFLPDGTVFAINRQN